MRVGTAWLGAGLIAASLAACVTNEAPPAGETLVRLRNGTAETMEQIRIGYPDEARSDRLAPGEATPYQSVPGTVGTIYFEASIGGERLVIQPYDFMGRRYPPGRYTYTVSFTDPAATGPSRRLSVRVAPDR